MGDLADVGGEGRSLAVDAGESLREGDAFGRLSVVVMEQCRVVLDFVDDVFTVEVGEGDLALIGVGDEEVVDRRRWGLEWLGGSCRVSVS